MVYDVSGLNPLSSLIIMGLSPKRRIPQSSVRSAIANILFICYEFN